MELTNYSPYVVDLAPIRCIKYPYNVVSIIKMQAGIEKLSLYISDFYKAMMRCDG